MAPGARSGRSWAPKIDVALRWLIRILIRDPVIALGRAYWWLNNIDQPREGGPPPPPRIPRWEDLRPFLRWAITVVVGALLVALVLLSAWLLLRTLAVALGLDWFGPVADPWADIRNGLLVVAASLGAPFFVWRAWLHGRQTRIAQETHFTDLYSKAVEMLGADKTVKTLIEKPLYRKKGDDYLRDAEGEPVPLTKADGSPRTRSETAERTEPNIEVRLGAIYALERIANESERDYRPIIETVCAYIRHNAGPAIDPTEAEVQPLPPFLPDERVETPEMLAARLVATRDYVEAMSNWATNLHGQIRTRGVAAMGRPDLRAALDVLLRRRPVDRWRLEGWEPPDPTPLELPASVDVDRCRDEVNAYAARLRGESGYSSKTSRPRWNVDLGSASLQDLDGIGFNTDLRRVFLRGARLDAASLSGARFDEADLSWASLNGAYLLSASLRAADMDHASLVAAHLGAARLECARIISADMRGAYLGSARLSGALLSSSLLSCADLRGANLRGAYLYSADLCGANCFGSNFFGANLLCAIASGANFDSANLDASIIASADLSGALCLNIRQVSAAFGDGMTKLPHRLEALRFRLINESGWIEHSLDPDETESAYRDWRAAGYPRPFSD